MCQTKKRKEDHIDIVLNKDVSHTKTTGLEEVHIKGFEDIELNYTELPEIDLNSVDISTEFLGIPFSAPLFISGMVGGIKRAERINTNIAKACQKLGIGMGVGSQRAMIEYPETAKTFNVRDVAPDIFIAGNIGAIQLQEYSIEQLETMLANIGANALAIHVNAAQEAAQPEGDTNFTGALEGITKVSKALSKPVYIKGVGHGISFLLAQKLAKTGIKALDVQGAGGTSWTAIDGMRGNKELAETFRDVGIPTAVSVYACRKAFSGQIIASGGIQNGLDVVKAIVLGADLGGIATPIIKAEARGGVQGVTELLERTIKEITIGCYLLGCNNLKELKKKKPVLVGKTKEWIEQLEN